MINYPSSTNNKRKLGFINGKIEKHQEDGDHLKWNGTKNYKESSIMWKTICSGGKNPLTKTWYRTLRAAPLVSFRRSFPI